MLVIIRERLLEHLTELPQVLDLYASGDPGFVDSAVEWLSDAEATLVRHRQSAVPLLSTQRGLIIAVRDGYHDPELDSSAIPRRKAVRATASVCLARSEAALRDRIDAIDEHLAPLRRQMAQLLSVTSVVRPISLPAEPPANRQRWLERVWHELPINGDTKPMYDYLNASLAPVDRLYLLDELVTNLLSWGAPVESAHREASKGT